MRNLCGGDLQGNVQARKEINQCEINWRFVANKVRFNKRLAMGLNKTKEGFVGMSFDSFEFEGTMAQQHWKQIGVVREMRTLWGQKSVEGVAGKTVRWGHKMQWG